MIPPKREKSVEKHPIEVKEIEEVKWDGKEHKIAKPKPKSPTRPVEIKKEEVKWDGSEHKLVKPKAKSPTRSSTPPILAR